jgi:hypothetical protein
VPSAGSRSQTETEDVVALWRLQSAYADIITRRAWPDLHDVFLPETTIRVDMVTAPARTLVGPEAFGAFVSGAIERYDYFAFVILNSVVDVDGDRARGRIFMCEVRHDIASDTWPNAYGVYQDTYARVGGRWWFLERHYRSMARMGADASVFGLPPDLGPFDR